MNKKLTVLVVDDASFMTKAISELLNGDPDIEVIGTACNGLDGLGKIKQLHPDVVTLDIDMPVMDGLQAIRHIMIESPVPIVVLSSLYGDGAITFEALRLGVVDFVAKPSGAISRDIQTDKQRILDRIKLAATVNLVNLRRVKLNSFNEISNQKYPLDYLIAIGTTLSGPNSFIRLMSKLSLKLPASVVVVLEISPKVLPSFVEKFNEFVPWEIQIPEDYKELQQGTCYIHSNEHEITVYKDMKGKVRFKIRDAVESPLDSFFSSAAQVFGRKTIGVLLTGCGSDGADGFAAIQEKSGLTIAQSMDTCVYPNLVDNVIKHGVVDKVVEEEKLVETMMLAEELSRACGLD